MQATELQAEREEFAKAFDEDFKVADGDFPEELPEKTLADRLQDGKKLAAGDGVSSRTHEAMKKEKVGPYEEKPPAEKPSEGFGTYGRQDTPEEAAARKKKSDDSLREAMRKRGF